MSCVSNVVVEFKLEIWGMMKFYSLRNFMTLLKFCMLLYTCDKRSVLPIYISGVIFRTWFKKELLFNQEPLLESCHRIPFVPSYPTWKKKTILIELEVRTYKVETITLSTDRQRWVESKNWKINIMSSHTSKRLDCLFDRQHHTTLQKYCNCTHTPFN